MMAKKKKLKKQKEHKTKMNFQNEKNENPPKNDFAISQNQADEGTCKSVGSPSV